MCLERDVLVNCFALERGQASDVPWGRVCLWSWGVGGKYDLLFTKQVFASL